MLADAKIRSAKPRPKPRKLADANPRPSRHAGVPFLTAGVATPFDA